MDPATPHPVRLLGLSLVAWNDGPTVDGQKQPGSWRVFEDACPHRLAPMSEGRVEADGNLLCSYHGWRFDSGGACSDLPYLSGPPEQQQKRKLCAACRSYPTRVEDGMLWVYPRSGPDGAAEAAATVL